MGWSVLGTIVIVETTFSRMVADEVSVLPNMNILENPFFLNFSDVFKDLECKYYDEPTFINNFNNSPQKNFAISMNIRSLPNKFTHVICIQETW